MITLFLPIKYKKYSKIISSEIFSIEDNGFNIIFTDTFHRYETYNYNKFRVPNNMDTLKFKSNEILIIRMIRKIDIDNYYYSINKVNL